MYVKVYRKRIESVRAVQLTPETLVEAARWCGGKSVEEKDPFDESQIKVGLNVPTLEGVLRASEGDYILQDWEGGFRIMQAYEFEQMYERPTRD